MVAARRLPLLTAQRCRSQRKWFRAWPIPEPSKERHTPVGLLAHGSAYPVLTFPERCRPSGCHPERGHTPHTHRLQLQGQLRNRTAFPLPWRFVLLGARVRERNPRSHALRARRCGRPVGLAALRAVTEPNHKVGWATLGQKGRKRNRAPRPASEGENKESSFEPVP